MAVGETDSFDGCLEDVMEEGVTGRPADFVAGDIRDRKGETDGVGL